MRKRCRANESPASFILSSVQSDDVRVIDDFLEVFSVNLQAITNLCDVVESGNELTFIMRVMNTEGSICVLLCENITYPAVGKRADCQGRSFV